MVPAASPHSTAPDYLPVVVLPLCCHSWALAACGEAGGHPPHIQWAMWVGLSATYMGNSIVLE